MLIVMLCLLFSTCTVNLDDVAIAAATADTKQEAKSAAFEAAVRTLQRECYTIRVSGTHRDSIE